jgi:hypothetical protein
VRDETSDFPAARFPPMTMRHHSGRAGNTPTRARIIGAQTSATGRERRCGRLWTGRCWSKMRAVATGPRGRRLATPDQRPPGQHRLNARESIGRRADAALKQQRAAELLNDDLRADLDPAIEIDHVLIGHANTAR